MPRDGAIIFSDLVGKLDVLRVSCEKCGRDGCYGLNRHIEKRGRDGKPIDWLDELTAECPKKIARSMMIRAARSEGSVEQCGTRELRRRISKRAA